MLMTTDPGDLVLDPTCGSGTTAHVAEQWGRRWITIDVSRIPLALARQRLLTGTFPWYDLKDESRGPAGDFVYKAWEQQAAYALDTHKAVAAFVKNQGLEFTIPYFHNGEDHDYYPDFLVRIEAPAVYHLKRDTGGGFTEYRLVGRMVRPVPPVEEDAGEGGDDRSGLALPKPDA
jgi:hypothetical protein